MAEAQDAVDILLVSPFEEDYRNLSTVLSRSPYRLERVAGSEDAAGRMQAAKPRIVIAEDSVDWRRLCDALERLDRPPLLVVVSRLADDELWLDVLNHGGHDLISKPFQSGDLQRLAKQVRGPAGEVTEDEAEAAVAR